MVMTRSFALIALAFSLSPAAFSFPVNQWVVSATQTDPGTCLWNSMLLKAPFIAACCVGGAYTDARANACPAPVTGEAELNYCMIEFVNLLQNQVAETAASDDLTSDAPLVNPSPIPTFSVPAVIVFPGTPATAK